MKDNLIKYAKMEIDPEIAKMIDRAVEDQPVITLKFKKGTSRKVRKVFNDALKANYEKIETEYLKIMRQVFTGEI